MNNVFLGVNTLTDGVLSIEEENHNEFIKTYNIESKNIELYKFNNVFDECCFAIKKMQWLVINSGYSYNDFVIVTGGKIDLAKLENAKKDLSILHPLPRVNEITTAVDEDSRACYFKQAMYGKYIRMALILKLLEVE